MDIVPKLTKAIKHHQCECCENTIRPDSLYWNLTAFEQPITRAKICSYCYHNFFDRQWISYLRIYMTSLREILTFMQCEYAKDQVISMDEARGEWLQEERLLRGR